MVPSTVFSKVFIKTTQGIFIDTAGNLSVNLRITQFANEDIPWQKGEFFRRSYCRGTHLPPTTQTSLKFRDFAELYLLQQISSKLGKFANFKAIFPAVSMDISQLNKLECALEAVWRVFRQLVHAGYSCLNSPNVTIGPFTGHPDNTYINSRQKNKLQRRPLGYVIAVSCFLASFLPNLRIDSNVFDTKDVRTYG